jgi:transposase
METFTMSRKELPRVGLLAAAVAGRISNREGAAALRVTPRQFQRLKQRFRLGGALAVRHQGRGRPSHRRLPATLCAQVQALLRDRYAGFNDTHCTEKLRELHGLAISRESVRRLRRSLGVPAMHRRRPPQHRSRRPRETAAGQLLQIDGRPFDWLEGRGPTMTLLGAIDDATSEVIALHFRPTKTCTATPLCFTRSSPPSGCRWRSTATASIFWPPDPAPGGAVSRGQGEPAGIGPIVLVIAPIA